MISKIGIFILLFSFFHLVCSFPPALVDTNKCKKRNGNFPKPGSSCRSYYKCTNWNPEEMMCPGDQHFFPARGFCVWPEEYPCLEKPKSKDCPLPNGKFLKPGTECKVYYDCCNGVPAEKRCAEDLLFNSIDGKCDWPELVTCLEEPKSEKCTRPNGKFLRLGTKCRIYYDCRNGVATEKRCPKDQLFDPAREKCEWPEIYTCVEDVSTIESTTQSTSILSTTTPTLVSISTEENIISTTSSPISNVSITEIPIQSTSTPSTVTYPLISISTEENVITTSNDPRTDSDEDSSEEGTSSREDKQSSTKLYTYSEVVTDKTSPEATETITNKTTDSTTTTSYITDSVTYHVFCPKTDGHFPHPYDRHKFVACVGGNPIIMDCPENLVYDQKTKSCQYERKYKK